MSGFLPMTARTNRPSGFFRGVFTSSVSEHISLSAFALFACLCLVNPTDVFAQSVGTGKPDSREEGGVSPGKSSAVIGDSGYVVPIPEISIRNIIGERPPKRSPEDEEQDKKLPPQEKSYSRDLEDTDPAAPVQRLPFDPVEGDSPDRQSGVEESPSLETPPETTTNEPLPAESQPAKKEAADKDSESPWLKPPLAPEDIGERPFEAKKEVLRGKVLPRIPSVLNTDLSKEALKPLTVDSVTGGENSTEPDELLHLDTRRDPEIVSVVETQPEPERTTQPDSAPALETEKPGQQSPEPQPMQPPEPGEVGRGRPSLEPVEEKEEAKESIPSREKLPPPAKEYVPSPLEDDVLDSREVKSYLKETAPILEELSLLMTRSPALTIEDYDPSDANAPVIPQDILVKMNSMKRELEVLDSKTFAVIPPAKYSDFHSLIRQSITQAHQACHSIIEYFQESKSENFQKAREHLLKAGELIRRTQLHPDHG